MMTALLQNAVLAFIGIAGGVAVGGGLVAFLVVLDIIPRLAQMTKGFKQVSWFESAIIVGTLYWTAADFLDWKWRLPVLVTCFFGLLTGMFTGMLAGALTEVLNVLPIMAKRLHLGGWIGWLLMAMALGKVVGSLFEWYVFGEL
ncbi:stage V sporulation protein AB [Paenibacillus sp. y28]|uniref:stage V sporulation protein AB n=1 Tax=Paenibacillus sp. y28 TaxID=3129110 RepID=UPI003019F3FF